MPWCSPPRVWPHAALVTYAQHLKHPAHVVARPLWYKVDSTEVTERSGKRNAWQMPAGIPAWTASLTIPTLLLGRRRMVDVLQLDGLAATGCLSGH